MQIYFGISRGITDAMDTLQLLTETKSATMNIFRKNLFSF